MSPITQRGRHARTNQVESPEQNHVDAAAFGEDRLTTSKDDQPAPLRKNQSFAFTPRHGGAFLRPDGIDGGRTFGAKGARQSLVPLMALAIAGLVLMFAQCAAKAYDNDMWWILATGQYIVENGIPYTNPFSMIEGLGIVVQQWLSSVILFGIYSVTGLLGCQVLVFFQQVLLTIVLYLLCRTTRAARGGKEVTLLLILLSFGALQAYISVRPHLYTMIAFALLLLVLEKYRVQGDPKLLVALPLIVAVHVNFHASMAPYDLFVVGVYLIPDVFDLLRRRGVPVGSMGFHAAGYARLPLVAALAACGVALLLNPYGLDGALYLVNSYGAADYSGYINEMGQTSFMADYGVTAMVCIVLGAMAVGVNGSKRINLPLTLLFLVTIPLCVMHTRNVWMVGFFFLPLVSQAFSGVSLWHPALRVLNKKRVVAAFSVVFIAVLGYGFGSYIIPEATKTVELDGGSIPLSAASYLDEYCEDNGLDKTDLKIYNSFNNGGYLEWRGYRVFIDARPELWEPAITGDERHYYQEFVDFAQNKTTTRELLENYTFDFMVVYSDCTLATDLAKRSDYQVVFGSMGYKLWKHV